MAEKNPLSLTEVGYSARFTRTRNRIIRLLWVFAANGLVAWFMFEAIGRVLFPLNFQTSFEFIFEGLIPMAGIVVEALNWKFARWVNVWSLTIAGGFWLIASLFNRSDPFFIVLLFVALGLLTLAGLTEFVYRKTTNAPSEKL